MNVYQQGTLAGGVPSIANVGSNNAPMTATLTSVAGGRKISVSTDGTNYVDATPTNSITAMINFAITYPVAFVKFTGSDGDTWSVR